MIISIYSKGTLLYDDDDEMQKQISFFFRTEVYSSCRKNKICVFDVFKLSSVVCLIIFFKFFFFFFLDIFSRSFWHQRIYDMTLVSRDIATRIFCDVQQQDEEELGILVVGWFEEKHPGGIRAWQPKYYDTWYIYVCLGFHTKTQSLFQPCHVCDSRSLDKKDDNKISWSLISWLFWNFQSRSYCQSNYFFENTNLKFSDLFNVENLQLVFLK